MTLASIIIACTAMAISLTSLLVSTYHASQLRRHFHAHRVANRHPVPQTSHRSKKGGW